LGKIRTSIIAARRGGRRPLLGYAGEDVKYVPHCKLSRDHIREEEYMKLETLTSLIKNWKETRE